MLQICKTERRNPIGSSFAVKFICIAEASTSLKCRGFLCRVSEWIRDWNHDWDNERT